MLYDVPQCKINHPDTLKINNPHPTSHPHTHHAVRPIHFQQEKEWITLPLENKIIFCNRYDEASPRQPTLKHFHKNITMTGCPNPAPPAEPWGAAQDSLAAAGCGELQCPRDPAGTWDARRHTHDTPEHTRGDKNSKEKKRIKRAYLHTLPLETLNSCFHADTKKIAQHRQNLHFHLLHGCSACSARFHTCAN